MVNPPNIIEKRLLWHPRRENKFVVGGLNQITLYEYAAEFPEIRRGTSQHDLQHMRCFAWSPDPTYDDLFAIGTTTGRVDLIRLEANRQSRQHNILSSGPTASLSVKSTRACSALAFNSVDPNYLAVGLEKVRDNSLVIWDISTTTPSLIFSPGAYSQDTTIKITPSLPRPSPGIARSDLPRTDPRILQQHAPAEHVLSLAFLPQSTHLLFAASNRWLKFYDLRNPMPTPQNVNIRVQGIATDPFDIHRVACLNEGTVSIWDHRRLTHPILTIAEKDGAADGSLMRTAPYAMAEFSSTRRGTLATLQRDGIYVRFWDLMNVQFCERWTENERMRDVPGRSTARKGWSIPSWSSVQTPSPMRSQDSSALLLAETRRTKYFEGVLSSFALVPSHESNPLTSNVMVVNKEGDLELYAVHDTPKQNAWNARGDLVYGAGKALRVLGGITESATPEPWEISDQQASPRSAQEHGKGQQRGSSSERGSHDSMAEEYHNAEGSPETGREWGSSRQNNVNTTPPALFGRGDEDGFPALGTSGSSANTTTTTAMTTAIQKGGISTQRDQPGRARLRVTSQRLYAQDTGLELSRKRDTSVPTRVKVRGVRSVVEEDTSMVIRRRALLGYGLSKPGHNIYVTRDRKGRDASSQVLSELWDWIHHSQELLSTPTSQVHGFDFAFQGLLGIWEGFPPLPSASRGVSQQQAAIKQDPAFRELLEPPTLLGPHRATKRSLSPGEELRGNYQTALLALIGRSSLDKGQWKPMIVTGKAVQRQVALWLCGWGFREDDMTKMIEKWEAERHYSRAACWLVFTKRYNEAVRLLMQSNDESHRMMSGTVAALIPALTGGARSPELREHCERLIVRLHDPYFRALLTQLTTGEWAEVLEEDIFPLRERLAIAFQFLDDKALSSYLRRVTDQAISSGDIDGLVVTGLTKRGIDILQGFVDRTGDVQTSAILGSYVCPMQFKDIRVDRWLEAYRDILDGFKLHHHRVGFDIERGQRLHDAMQAGDLLPSEWAPRQILLRCGYCGKVIDTSTVDQPVDQQPQPQKQKPAQAQKGQFQGRIEVDKSTLCPHCGKYLPRCSVCLMTLGIIHDKAREQEMIHSSYRDTIDDALVICQTCRHGGHATHILEWFFDEDGKLSRRVCAVADCNCRCADHF